MTKIRRKKLTTPPHRKHGPIIEWVNPTHCEAIVDHQDALNASRKSAVATSHLISAAAL